MRKTLLFYTAALCAVIAGTTAQAQTYCTPTDAGEDNCTYEVFITDFSTSHGITNITNNNNYDCTTGYVPGVVHTEGRGETVAYSIRHTYEGFHRIWIDWNEDGDFDDADELVAQSSFVMPNTFKTGSFMVPLNATPGTKRMRVRYAYVVSQDGFTPCNYQHNSDYADYDFVVTANQPYCIPSQDLTSCSNNYAISNFTTTGGLVNINYSNPACTNGFIAGQQHVGTLGQTTSYNMTTGYDGYHKVWIDWNADSDFDDAGELVVSSGYTSASDGSFTIPLTATVGTTKMRVRYTNSDYLNTGYTPCDYQVNSEYEDYEFVVAQPCTGTPTAGTASATGTTICGQGDVPLTLTGQSADADMALQWQVSYDGNTWYDLYEANAANYSAVEVSTTSLFRAAVTCPASAQTAYSNIITATVTTPVDAAVSINAPSTICNASPATFTATGTALDGGTYTWYRNGTEISGENGATLTLSTISPTTAESIEVTVSGITACVNDANAVSAPVSVQATPAPMAAVIVTAGSKTLCDGQGQEVTFGLKMTGTNGQPINQMPLGYQWAKDGTDITGETNPTYAATEAGGYTLTLTDLNTGCVKTSSVQQVVVNPTPTANVILSGSTALCPNTAITLTADATSGATVRWKRDGATTVGSANSYTTKVIADYTLIATLNGCADTSAPVSLSSVPPPSTSLIVQGSTQVCTGGLPTYLQVIQRSGQTYQWYKGSNPIAGEIYSEYVPTASGNYKIGISRGGCPAKFSAPVSITVTNLPTAKVTFVELYNGSMAVLKGTTGNYNYQWYLNDEPLQGEISQYLWTILNGNYRVEISRNGCSKLSDPFVVSNLPVYNKMASAIEADKAISVYPNPSDGVYYIAAEQAVNIVVRDIQGRIVADVTGASSVDLTAQPSGIYLMQLMDANGMLLQSERLVKR